jgi:hypothetical protein
MTEEKKPFTVSDRRHFTAEGETRSQPPEETPTPPPHPPAPKVEKAEEPEKNAAPTPPTEKKGTEQRASDSFASERHGGERERARGGAAPDHVPPRVDEQNDEAPPMDFIGLLVSLATQAGYLMSPEPGSGAPPDLAGARSIIALLEILKQKTEGRRTPDEDRVLDGLLYELRMAFVSRTRPEKA